MSGLATKSLLRSSFTGSGGMIQPNDIKSAANILIQQSGGPGLSGNRRLEEFHINLATRLANDSRVQDIYCEHLYDETWERPASQSLKDTEEFCAHKREAIRQMLNQVEHYIGESKIIQEEIKVLEDREAHPAVSTAGFELSTTETKYSDSPQNISKAFVLVETLQKAFQAVASVDPELVKSKFVKVPTAIMSMMLDLIAKIWGSDKSQEAKTGEAAEGLQDEIRAEAKPCPGVSRLVINIASFLITLSLIRRFASAKDMDKIEMTVQSYIAIRARPETEGERGLM
mmetsp:Transcript_16046/g.32533  ORF Transcript_16046/g.32533 Transcript_16046/m.32533 type:complete len:286 (+) Transcript_16046:64-921(+)